MQGKALSSEHNCSRVIFKMQEDKNAIFQLRFPQKLWYLLNLRTDAIIWGGTGRTILLNYRVLYNYLQCNHSIFKTTNISSFVRQLNLYGFRKVTSHLQDPLCNSSNPYMHEYVHDYFQFGRPELLNKITRKALTMRRSFKPKNTFNCMDQLHCLTPLQKARHALRVALKNAAQEIFKQSSPMINIRLDYEDSQDYQCEEEDNLDFDWFQPSTSNTTQTQHPTQIPPPRKDPIPEIKQEKICEVECTPKEETMDSAKDNSQDSLMNFQENTQQNCDSFPSQFLSMPDLDSEPTDSKCVELLAEFNIDSNIEQGITRKMSDDLSSLNCVLPSISHDQNDDVSMNESHSNDTDHYNGEWDQMFSEFIASKDSTPECGSDLKELYSQISKTIDLLNS